MEHRDQLISLNKIEIALGLIVSAVSLIGCFGSWYVMPYRVTQVELKQAALENKLDAMQRSGEATREIVIRIDERIRQGLPLAKPNSP